MHVPEESIYFWMFTQGLKHVPLADIVLACKQVGKDIRQKDIENYWNGYYKSELYGEHRSAFRFARAHKPASKNYFELGYEDYPIHPYLGKPNPESRFVPCDKNNRPMIKWGRGCLSFTDAKAYPNSVYVGENLLGCKYIVIDCDGDHGDEIDYDTVLFMSQFMGMTHTLTKPKTINQYNGYETDTVHGSLPASFHLTFKVDREIPTMHFPKAKIDIVGNRENSLRYFKDKNWNGKEAIDMTPEIWEKFKGYIRRREEA